MSLKLTPMLQFNRLLAVYNTQLLKRYASIDPRVWRLGIFVNWWAEDAGINGRDRGYLDSDAWLLQVIEYAKHCGLVPSLEEPPFAPVEPQTVDGYEIKFFQDEKGVCPILPNMPGNVVGKLSAEKKNAQKYEASLSDLALGFMRFCSLRWNKSIDIRVTTSVYIS